MIDIDMEVKPIDKIIKYISHIKIFTELIQYYYHKKEINKEQIIKVIVFILLIVY